MIRKQNMFTSLVLALAIGTWVLCTGITFSSPASTQQGWQSKFGTSFSKELYTSKKSLKQNSFDAMLYVISADAPSEHQNKSQNVAALQRASQDSQAALIRLLDNWNVSYQSYYLGNAIALSDVSLQQLETLAQRDDVLKIRSNAPVQYLKLPPKEQHTLKSVNQDNEPQGVEAAIVSTGATELWKAGFYGQGIVVAGQDTGVEWDHPSLLKKYRGYNAETGEVVHDYSWHDAIQKPIDGGRNRCGYAAKAPCDDHGHGTHTVGTMVGDDEKGNQIGMAPKATWIACRNMDNGVGRPSSYLECFQYFLAPWPYGGDPIKDADPSKGAHVINNSWGCSSAEFCEGDEFVEVLQALHDAGVMVVASAGNEGPGCSTIANPPAHYSNLVLSVGASNHRNNSIASFSSRGPSAFDGGVGPHISAPGVSIRSAVPGKRYEGGWSGTSMAGPHVAGAVALLWSASSTLKGDPEATKTLLQTSATARKSSQNCGGVRGDEVPNNVFGYGIMDLKKALTALPL